MGSPDWHTAMHSLRLQRLLWIYCPGHTGVSGNERADRLASTADITFGLQLGRAEVLRGLRNFLNMDRLEHHSTDRLKERGVEKGSGWHSTLGPPRSRMFCVQPGKLLALFRGQPWGDCWETGQSLYGPFRVLQCHLELKLKLKLKPHWSCSEAWDRALKDNKPITIPLKSYYDSGLSTEMHVERLPWHHP